MKISIIGLGKVGSAIAFSLLHKVKMDHLVLIDIVENLVKGECLDLSHAAVTLAPEAELTYSKEYSALTDSDIIIITAGRARKATESRADLFEFNKKIVMDIYENIKKYSPRSEIVLLTNPSTQLGELIEKDHPPQLIVMDNQLDTARLKYFIHEETKLPFSKIKSFITGEHGPEMVFHLKDDLTPEQKEKIEKQVMDAGVDIITLKGYTCWGIAAEVLREVQNLLKK